MILEDYSYENNSKVKEPTMKYLPDYSSRFRILKGGKISLVVSALVAGSTITFASPSGGEVTTGSANISQNGTITSINQSSNKASINWQSFSIAPNETVNFNQPSASSITLNRVIGANRSLIEGAMNANGQVFLINPNGVLFSKGAQINVGGLVASTLNITDANFQAGNYVFEGDSQNSIINMGTITASNGGYVAMIGKTVVNEGSIVATLGKVELAGGSKISLNLSGNSLMKLTIDEVIFNALVENKGLIKADGGEVILSTAALNTILESMVNNTGVIEAQGVGSVNGVIQLLADGGEVTNSGKLDVSSLADKGGEVTISADTITLSETSIIDAKGKNGGGNVLVGGDWQGSGTMHQATKTTMLKGASIDASAVESGDGGKVVLWSDVSKADSKTIAHGSVLANGGTLSGKGGKVETSGHEVDIDGFSVNTLAPQGEAGLWLIDPYNYVIDGAAASTITSALNNSSVTVTTTASNTSHGASTNNADAGDITLNGHIDKTSNNETTLTLEAARNIKVGDSGYIYTTNGKLNVNFHADTDKDGDGIIYVAGDNIYTNGGNLTFGNNQTAIIGGQNVRVGGDVFFQRDSAQTLDTNGGALNIYGETIVANTSGLTINTAGGNVNFHGLVNSGNQYTFIPKSDSTEGLAHWDLARTEAKNGTAGGSATNNSYLVTITSRLENSIAGLAADYKGAWIGAWRADPNNHAWSWADGPEAGQVFFTQNASGGGGTTTSGYYSNFGSGEPNGILNTNRNGTETSGQFFGTSGQWNDLTYTNYYQPGNTNQHAVTGFLRETNLDASPVTINAGSGAVTINGSVGASKALASLSVTSGSTTINGNALITTGAQTYNNALKVNSTGNLQVTATNLSVTNASQALTFKATGDIKQSSGLNVSTNNGNVIYWADSDASGNSNTAGGSISTDGGSITTNGGKIVMAGGGDSNGDDIPDGFAIGAASNEWGISIAGTTLNAGTGDILLRGRSTGTGGGTNIGVRMYSNPAMTITSSNFTAEGYGSIQGTSVSENNWGVSMEGVNLIASGNVNITGTGGTTTSGKNNHGVLLNGTSSTIATTATSKTITINGTGGSGSAGENDGVAIGSAYTIGNANTGAISIAGTTNSNTANSEGVSIFGKIISGANGGTAISVSGTNTNAAGGDGIYIDANSNTKIHALGSGGISVTGSAANSAKKGIYGTNLEIFAKSGEIVIDGGSAGLELSGTFGKKDGTSITAGGAVSLIAGSIKTIGSGLTLNAGSNNILIRANGVTGHRIAINTTGGFTYEPLGSNWTDVGPTLNFKGEIDSGNFIGNTDVPWLIINNISNLGGLTLGKTGNTSSIAINSELGIAGPINIYGDNIVIGALLSTTGTNAITLKASGAITQTAAITADKLALLGGTTITLENANNAIGTIAASNVGSLSYVDKDGLIISTVGSTDGISATGAVSISTLSGDLSLNKNVSTTDTTADALVLNAGKNAVAGTATGGNIIMSGAPTISVGADGTAKLYTGSIAGSTALATYIGSGSGRFRYGSDEITQGYTKALGTGLNAIYREEPTASVTVADKTMTYGDVQVSLSGTLSGVSNGDVADYVINYRLDSTSTNIKAGNYTLDETGLASLGYDATVTTGTLAVDKKALAIGAIAAENKIYDGAKTATLDYASATKTGLVGGDVLTLSATGEFTDKNVANGKTVNLTTTYAGADKDNYTITDQATATANITQKVLTISGITVANKVYDSLTTSTVDTTNVTKTGLVSGDELLIASTGTFGTKDAAIGKIVTLSSTYTGNDVGNYAITNQATTTADITKKQVSLDLAGAGTKVYDGQTTLNLTGITPSLLGVIGGDSVTIATGNVTGFVDKNVGENKAVTFTGFALGSTDAGNYDIGAGSAASTASITRLSSVTWIGGNTGNWFDPTNWAGGAVPDLSNVANVVIPDGVTVSFDTTGATGGAQTGTVNIDSLGNDGSMNMSNGTLHVENDTTLNSLTQSGGSIETKSLHVTDSFAQNGTAGTIAVTNDATINQTLGNMTLGNITTGGKLDATAAGNIEQVANTTISATGDTTLASTNGNIALNSATNDFKSTVDASGVNVALADINGIKLGDITATGTLVVNAQSDITQTLNSLISAAGETSLVSTLGDITLNNANNDFSTINAIGKNIVLADKNGINLGDIAATGTLGVNAINNITQASGTEIVTTGDVVLASTAGDIILGSANNNFGGSFGASANTVELTNYNQPLALGNIVSNTALNIKTNDQAITQATGTTVKAKGTASLDAGTSTIALSNSGNDYGAITLKGSSVFAATTVSEIAAKKAAEAANQGNAKITETIIANITSGAIVIPFVSQSGMASMQPQTTQASGSEYISQTFTPENSTGTTNSYTLVGTSEGKDVLKMVSMEELQKSIPEGEEVRVPVGQGSIVELINGGVNLPVGVSQEFYVVTDTTSDNKKSKK